MNSLFRQSSSQIAESLAVLQLSENSQLFAFDNILKHINTIRMEVDGVRWDPEDIEHIHRMRVASRRLRNSLVLFQGCFPKQNVKKWRKQIQLVTQTLGIARDLDVQIDSLQQIINNLPEKKYKAGIRRILLRLSQNRQKIQKQVIEIVNDLLKGQVLINIDQAVASQLSQIIHPSLVIMDLAQEEPQTVEYMPDLYRLAREAIHLRIHNLLLYKGYIYQFNQDIEELHIMRKSAKWLRYTMETFSPLYESKLKNSIQITRKIQDYLGDIHDSDVWSQYIPFLIEKEKKRTIKYYGHLRPLNPIMPGINYFQYNWQADRTRKYEEFLDSWQKWKSENAFDHLKQEITEALDNHLPDAQSSPDVVNNNIDLQSASTLPS